VALFSVEEIKSLFIKLLNPFKEKDSCAIPSLKKI